MSIPNEGRFEKPIERRDFLGIAAVGSFLVTTGLATVGSLRLPMPSVLPEADSRVKIGSPDQFAVGSQTYLSEQNVWIERDDKGLYAISSICTHLGCVVKRDDNGFHCPCHGSRFDHGGKVTAGPAPKPLDHLKIARTPSGDLYVDLQTTVGPEARLEV